MHSTRTFVKSRLRWLDKLSIPKRNLVVGWLKTVGAPVMLIAYVGAILYEFWACTLDEKLGAIMAMCELLIICGGLFIVLVIVNFVSYVFLFNIGWICIGLTVVHSLLLMSGIFREEVLQFTGMFWWCYLYLALMGPLF